MKLEIELTGEELEALWVLARGRMIKIVAGQEAAAPADRAIAKVLLSAQALGGIQ